MKTLWAGLMGFLTFFQINVSIAQDNNQIELSRESGVRIISRSGNSSGSGFFIGDQTVVTCFHVVAKLTIQGQTIDAAIYPDLQVVIPSGETIDATVVSVPTQSDPTPKNDDFALIQLKNAPKKAISKVVLATESEFPNVGDEVVFSGYPLGTPGMVTHRGMVSGFDDSRALIFVEAPINKGNSGGGLLNAQGHAIGIVCDRVGGISKGLGDLSAYITETESHGRVAIMGVDPLQATKALIETLDTYISTGMGYAISIKFARDYISKSPQLVK
jgi:S1-C subfamily serine protease